MKRIKEIKLFINDDIRAKEVAEKLRKELEEKGFIITDKNYDLAISIGGDGTFLRMLKNEKFNKDVFYVGVNAGTLGFLQEIDIDNTKNFVERLVSENYKIEDISIQETIVQDKEIHKYYSLNEVVIRKGDFSLLKTPVYIDNELLENFTGDGLLISTSTGSTAYNMSFGGPIIYNTLKALSITPIAPLNNKIYHTLVNPVIVPMDKEIIFKFDNKDIFMMIDGVNMSFNNVQEIKTKVHNHRIQCLRMNDFHFIRTVNHKILDK